MESTTAAAEAANIDMNEEAADATGEAPHEPVATPALPISTVPEDVCPVDVPSSAEEVTPPGRPGRSLSDILASLQSIMGLRQQREAMSLDVCQTEQGPMPAQQ